MKDQDSCEVEMGSGKLTLVNLNISEKASFLDYIFGGCEIGVHIAVDYTLSNGPVKDRNSLHYLHGGQNQYTQAINAVCSIL